MEYNFFVETNKNESEKKAIMALKKWNLDWKTEKEKIVEILQEIFDSDKSPLIEKNDMGLFLSTLLYISDEKIVERALRNIYYVVKKENSNKSTDLLFGYCSNAFDEKRELVRGRKHWITLSIMQKNNFSDDDIESYVRKLKDKEYSPWVWERIFGVLVTWDASYRIYPEIKSWNLPEGAMENNSRNFVRNILYRYSNSMGIQQGILGRTGRWIQLAIDKKINYDELDWLFRENGEVNGYFPLTVNLFESMYERKDEFSRIILLHYLCRFLEKGLWEKVTPYIDIIRKTNPLKDNLYEEMSHLLIQIFTFMEGRTNKSPFYNILEFLSLSISEKYNRPEIYYAISSSFTPLLLRFITDKTEKTLDIDKIGVFLEHPSAYLQLLAATLLLHAWRNDYDISSTIGPLKNYIGNNPTTKNTFASGKDIEPDEFNFRYNFGSATGFVGIANEGEEGFFNLGGLTGLLEACQPPTVSYRVALALREFGEAKNDSELLVFLSSFKSQNEALKDLDFENFQEQEPMLSSFMAMKREELIEMEPEETPILELNEEYKTPAQILPSGPMKLPELEKLFTNSVNSDKLELKEIASKKQEEIKKLYKRVNRKTQHNLIKQAFGDKNSTEIVEDTGTGHFASIFHRMEEGLNLKLDLCKDEPDNSIDYLACYLPQNSIDISSAHRYGIYFFTNRCITLIKKYNINTSLFIKTIAVHELFHAHMDLMIDFKGKYHSHKGENPPYCRLEEAAANFMAHKWLFEQNASDKEKNDIANVIFKTVGNGGIPGYGEYDLMDDDAAEFLPGMIIDKECNVLPPTYINEKVLLTWGFNIKRQKARQIWGSLLKDIDEEVVPFYFDWEVL